VAAESRPTRWTRRRHPGRKARMPPRRQAPQGPAREYDRTYAFAIPAGRHRVTIQNAGGDWATIAWYALKGEVGEW